MSKAEREIHFKAREIAKSTDSFESLTEQEKAVVNQSYSLLMERVFDLFSNFLLPMIFGDDKWAMFCFTSRFHWLIHDAKLWAERLHAEHELFEEAEEKGLCEGQIARASENRM
jgi:hypothetical protein